MDEIRVYCKEKFELLDKRISSKSIITNKHETDIEVLKRDFSHLTKSLDGLTKAIWGAVGTTFISLLGFFIWYIQKL